MKTISLVVLYCAVWEVRGYPYYPYYGNMDSLSYGASESSRGGMVLSRYYNPYYNPVGGGMAAFIFRQPEEQTQVQPSQYYLPDRRRQTPPDTFFENRPQENEVFYPQAPQKPTDPTDIAFPTEKTEVIPTTVKTVVQEITEPEVEEVEPEQKPKKRVPKKKQVKKPVDDDEEEDDVPKMPAGAFFPMFFGWGGRSGGGGHGGSGHEGAVAIANAYSTGRGGMATSHATAYGPPRPNYKPHHEA